MSPAPLLRSRLQATVAAGIATLLWWRFQGNVSAVLAAVLGTFALLAWLAPRLYAPIQRGLDRFAHALLSGFTWLVLGVVYFGLFTPIRIWRALTRRDPLQLRIDPGAESYFQSLPSSAQRRFDRQF